MSIYRSKFVNGFKITLVDNDGSYVITCKELNGSQSMELHTDSLDSASLYYDKFDLFARTGSMVDTSVCFLGGGLWQSQEV